LFTGFDASGKPICAALPATACPVGSYIASINRQTLAPTCLPLGATVACQDGNSFISNYTWNGGTSVSTSCSPRVNPFALGFTPTVQMTNNQPQPPPAADPVPPSPPADYNLSFPVGGTPPAAPSCLVYLPPPPTPTPTAVPTATPTPTPTVAPPTPTPGPSLPPFSLCPTGQTWYCQPVGQGVGPCGCVPNSTPTPTPTPLPQLACGTAVAVPKDCISQGASGYWCNGSAGGSNAIVGGGCYCPTIDYYDACGNFLNSKQTNCGCT
jgi:hypothetical protein